MASSESVQKKDENWWEICPVCGSKLLSQRCRLVCSNSRCHYFQSCSEFDT
jgi:ssDNA-binding Zn-finger/Zn-ribbon topoisomerase 1